MTSKIYINLEFDTADEAREQMARLLGNTTFTPEYGSGSEPVVRPGANVTGAPPATLDEEVEATTDMPASSERHTFTVPDGHYAVRDSEGRATGETRPIRQRGKPSQGHAKRTKVEIAEDKAADEADAAIAKAGAETGAIVADKHVDEDPEVEAADAADEAAETAATKVANGDKLTLDDVRNALGLYVQKFGMDAAQQDGPAVLKLVCGDGVTKISALPDDQDILKRVVAGINEMLEKNPFKRTATVA